MLQGILSHLTFLNIHKDLLNGLCLKTMHGKPNKFVRGNEHHLSQFGKYQSICFIAAFFFLDKLKPILAFELEDFPAYYHVHLSSHPVAVIIFTIVP